MDLTDVLLLLGAGVGAGVVNSVAGGGSLITYPALVATGLGSVVANVTNSVAVSAGYASSAVGTWPDHRALERSQGKSVRALALTAAVGAVAGCALLLLTPATAFDKVVPFLVLGAVAVLAFQQRLKNLVGHPHELPRTRRTATLHTAVGLSAVYGGYFGAAVGIILVALIGLVMDETLIRVTALKNSLSVVIGLVTIAVFSAFGTAAGSPVHWASVAVLTPATLVGGYVGARVGRRLDPRVLRAVIVTFGTAVGLILGWRAFG
ncbi:sulfite exporter TauE/SafE family protein [Luedemannella flava]|uniref:Probable membrane transporter protein n=1 Tax=Luedemannella flava TaxID=349316 RepID=A0ABN2M6D5_9ACTN